MREMLNPTSTLVGMGLDKSVALITDGRFSGGNQRSQLLVMFLRSLHTAA